MSIKPTRGLSAIPVAALLALAAYAPVGQAFNFGDMMNPGRWMGGDRDRYDEYDEFYPGGPYDAPGFGYPPYGYGGPGYGLPYGAPGYGVPGYGAPAPGYGAPVFPGAPVAAPGAPPPAAPAAPASGSSVDSAEVQALKRRVEELEAAQKQGQSAPPPPPASGEWPSAPAFRPMNQY